MVGKKGAPTRLKRAGVTARFTAPAYWKFESISLQRRVCKLSVPERGRMGLKTAPPM